MEQTMNNQLDLITGNSLLSGINSQLMRRISYMMSIRAMN